MVYASPVRLIDANDTMVGIVEIDEAKRRAREAELDLVEIVPDSKPPVCRIMDFGKWKYEQSKKDKATKARSKSLRMKEVRLGRSMKIDPHDIENRVHQARRFLIDGHKVQIVQQFRGREMMHRERGTERMKQIIEQLSDLAKVEVPPRMAGRRITMILAPDKPKIERYKSLHSAKEAPEEAAPETRADDVAEAAEPAPALESGEAATTPPAQAKPAVARKG